MSALRSVGAVLGGFATTLALSVGTDGLMHATGLFPDPGAPMSDGLFAFAAVYRAAYTVAGGYVTARLAPGRPGRPVAALAVFGLLGGLAGLAVSLEHPEMGPLWYALSIPLSAVPCIWAGAWLRARQLRMAVA